MSNTLSTETPTSDGGSAAGGSQRRLLLAVGGGALLLVLALGAYFLFLSGGEEEDLGPVPSGAASLPEESKGEKDKNGGEQVPAEVDVDFAIGRDPFVPLAAEAVPEPAAPVDDTTDTGTDTGTDDPKDTGGTAPAPTPAPTPSPSPSPTPTEDPVTSFKVTVKSVDAGKEASVIEVNGKRYTVKVKDMFTNSKTGPFKLTRVGELPSGKDTATVVFGSDAPVELIAKDTVVFKL